MNVEVTVRGEVAEPVKRRAHEEIGRLERYVKGPVLGARVVLTQEQNPRLPLPSRAEGEVNLSGHPVRARVAAPSMDAAVDELAERLERQLRRFVELLVSRGQTPAQAPPGEWRHGSLPTTRPERSFRPPEERRIERRKSFAVGAMSAQEAALDMEALDHDFYLFRDVETDRDAVLYRRDDGQLAVIDPPGAPSPGGGGPPREPSRISEPIDLDTAVREMDELAHRFLFFVDAASGRANVIYLRFDGHYGLIQPAA